VTIQIIGGIHSTLSGFHYQFYLGWSFVHSNWGPFALPYSALAENGFWTVFEAYFSSWASVVLAIVIFALFGLTSEARATYSLGICSLGRLFGWTPVILKRIDKSELKLGARQINMSEQYVFFLSYKN
jgi:hypothetical protein